MTFDHYLVGSLFWFAGFACLAVLGLLSLLAKLRPPAAAEGGLASLGVRKKVGLIGGALLIAGALVLALGSIDF